MISFPTSPDDGDIYERWTWSDAANAWQLTAASASGGTGGATTFAALTDAASADLPTLNTPLATALSGKQPLAVALTGTTASFTTALASKLDGIEAGATADQDLSGYQPLSATLTATTASFTTAIATRLVNTSGTNTGDQDLSGYVPTSRTIAGRALSSNITLVSADISDAATSGTPGALVKYDASGNITAEDVNGGGANFYAFVGTDITTAFTYRISAAGLISADRAYSPPNASGTLALTASTTGIPDALHNATISGTVTFSGTGQASMRTSLAPTTITENGATRTLALTDVGNAIRCTTSCAITVPQYSSVPFLPGSVISILRFAGAITLIKTGVTINGDSALANVPVGGWFALRNYGTDLWDFI